MKLMDDVAGIVATRHCKTNVVTASVDAINFHDKIKKGTRTLRRMGGGGGLRPLHLWLLARTRRCPGPGVCPFATGSGKPESRALSSGSTPTPGARRCDSSVW